MPTTPASKGASGHPPVAPSSSPASPVPPTESVAPFHQGPTPEARGFLAKLLLQSRPADAYQAIVNRIAAGPIAALDPADVSADLLAFGVRGKGARQVLIRIWREAVEAFLADDSVSDGEARYLAGLRRALGLTEPELRAVEEAVVHARFQRAVTVALADDRLTLAERSRLDDLAAALRLPAEVAGRVLDRARQARVQQAADAAIADRRLSPTEVADLHALARALGATLTLDAETQRTFDRLSLLWRIDNGDLPTINAPILLQRGETCHATADAVWLEMRTRTERINYGGPVASIRICKGVRYRVGSTRVQRITRDELTELDRGTVYVTNKRIIFDGHRKNTAIRLASLIAFTPCSDGVILEKASGKPAHLLLSGTDLELFHAILSAALAQA